MHDTRSQSAHRSRPEDMSCIGRTACILFRRSFCSFVRRSKLSHLPVSMKTCIAYKFLSRFATDVVKCGTMARRSIAASFRSMHQSKRPYDDCHKSPRDCSRNSAARCQRGVYTFRVVAQRSLIGLPPRATPETVGLFSRGVNRDESRVFCTGIPSTPDQPVNGRSSQQAPTPWPAGAPLSGLNLLQVGALIKLGPPIGAPRQPTGALFSCPKHSASLGTLASIFPEGLKCFSHDQIPLHPLLQTCLRCRCAGCSAFAHNLSHTACLSLI